MMANFADLKRLSETMTRFAGKLLFEAVATGAAT